MIPVNTRNDFSSSGLAVTMHPVIRNRGKLLLRILTYMQVNEISFNEVKLIKDGNSIN
jgi:hypothetical protein